MLYHQGIYMMHKDLFWILMPAGVISICCAAFGFVGLFSPALLGWHSSIPLSVKIGLIVFALMPLLWILSFRLHLKSFWVYRSTHPTEMNVTIEVDEGSDHNSYFAILRCGEMGPGDERIPVYPPNWNVRTIGTDALARVFFDPKSKKPLVIEIDGKRLWSMAL
jgi:hypothetical protein